MEKTIIATNGHSDKKKAAQTPPVTAPGWIKKIKSSEVGAFALGLAAYNLLFVKLKNGIPFPPEEAAMTAEENGQLPSREEINHVIRENATVATSVTDEMSFGEAFQASRQELGAGHFFWWRGQFYNNYQEAEWNQLSEAEQAAFVQQAGSFKPEDMAPAPTIEEPGNTDRRENTGAADHYDSSSSNTSPQNISGSQQQEMEYFDNNNDGEDDTLLINIDDDPQAEVVQSWIDGVSYVLVDTGNDGMLDTIWMIDEEGNPYDPMPLDEEIPAPKLTREQHLDLLGGDGILDSLAIDDRGDDRADRLLVDMNNDGTYDVAYFDTDGDGKLDQVCKMVDGTFSNAVALNEPFESPMVGAIADAMTPGNPQPQTLTGANASSSPDSPGDNLSEEIEGLDEDANVDEFF